MFNLILQLTKKVLFFSLSLFLCWVSVFGGIAGGHFISGCGGKGSGVQSLRFSGLLAAFTPIASYRHMKAFRFAIG